MSDLPDDHRSGTAAPLAAPPSATAEPPDPATLAGEAALAADDRKATDLVVLEVGPVLGLAELFLLVTAGNERQLKAVAEAIEERLRTRFGQRPLRREGDPPSGWMLLDYGDVVCHLFLPEQRGFYDLERLWGDVDRRELLTDRPTGPRSPAGPDAGVTSRPGTGVEGWT